jgi:hypothetical protein
LKIDHTLVKESSRSYAGEDLSITSTITRIDVSKRYSCCCFSLCITSVQYFIVLCLLLFMYSVFASRSLVFRYPTLLAYLLPQCLNTTDILSHVSTNTMFVIRPLNPSTLIRIADSLAVKYAASKIKLSQLHCASYKCSPPYASSQVPTIQPHSPQNHQFH